MPNALSQWAWLGEKAIDLEAGVGGLGHPVEEFL